jgi:F0F1-type ATP synthase membrane subunit a
MDHALSQRALEIAAPFGFPITNSMVVTWIVALVLIVAARAATRRMTEVPAGLQNLLEWLIESLDALLLWPGAAADDRAHPPRPAQATSLRRG